MPTRSHGDPVRFSVLGPLRAQASGRALRIGGPCSQRILARLLLSAGRVLPIDRLISAAWPDGAPTTGRRQVQNRVAALRAVLTPHDAVIESHEAGYLLRVPAGSLDLDAFDRLVREAALCRDPELVADTMKQALDLWGGPALDGVRGGVLEREAAALDERRLGTLGDYLELRLAAGDQSELIPELGKLVVDHPLDERFLGLWMQALTRAGRTAEALDAYRLSRQRLVEQLGVEPSATLQEIHRKVLRGDQEPGPSRPVPALAPPIRQLPGDVPAFTARTEELAAIVATLGGGPGGRDTVPIVAVHGPGGIGKSALAVHAAHRLAERFPDGTLYIDLHGAVAGSPPLPPAEALGRVLRALGVSPAKVPDDVDEAAAQLRSVVSGRHLLMVLDNAKDHEQVVPLLPGAPSCGVLVTSRRTLLALPGAVHLKLDVLPAEDGLAYLRQAVGAQRTAAEPEAAGEIVHRSGGLPLALRIAAARLQGRPAWRLRTLATLLADDSRRLDELDLGGVGVRSSVTISYRELCDSADEVDREAAAAFRMLARLDGADVGVSVAATLLDRPRLDCERVLERLVDANLLTTPAPQRYGLHDLVRVCGRREESGTDDSAALTRALHWYVASTWATSVLLRPGDPRTRRTDPRWQAGGERFPDAGAALRWLEAERNNLVAVVHQAAADPGLPDELAVQQAHALHAFLRLRGYWHEAVEINQVALAICRHTGDQAGMALVHHDLGEALCRLGRRQETDGRFKPSGDCPPAATGRPEQPATRPAARARPVGGPAGSRHR